MLDPTEPDSFLEKLPPTQRFYLDLQRVLSERFQDAAQQYAAKHGEPLVESPEADITKTVCFADQVIDLECLGADGFSPSIVDSDESDEEVHAMLELYKDGSPFVHDQDLAFLDSTDYDDKEAPFKKHYYAVYALPELPPFAILDDLQEWARQQLHKADRAAGQPLKKADMWTVRDFLIDAGYTPHTLSDNDCTGLLKGLQKAPINLEYTRHNYGD